MKLTFKTDNVKQNNLLNLAFDIGKDELHSYSEIGNIQIQCLADHFPNQVDNILAKLTEYQNIACKNGFSNIHVICEPTGGYEKKLFTLAHQMLIPCSYVSGESVCKAKVIENNESSKTDSKDPRVILLVARCGKLIKPRFLPDPYELLRHYNRIYEQESEQKTYLKNLMHREIRNLFGDFSFKNAYLYERGGRALLTLYHANPYRIVISGYSRFFKRMRKQAPGIRKKTIERIWNDATASTKLGLADSLIELLDSRIEQLWKMYQSHETALEGIKQKMCAIYQKLVDCGQALPHPVEGFVSVVNLARITGEVGNWDDFSHKRALKRFGGMQLREKQSGYYRGKNKLSKKGRSRLRKILNQSIFHLIKKNRILGQFYHHKKQHGMCGTKAMTVVSRKLLDILFALAKPGTVFDPNRLFLCESQYQKVA
jgi:transposase